MTSRHVPGDVFDGQHASLEFGVVHAILALDGIVELFKLDERKVAANVDLRNAKRQRAT